MIVFKNGSKRDCTVRVDGRCPPLRYFALSGLDRHFKVAVRGKYPTVFFLNIAAVLRLFLCKSMVCYFDIHKEYPENIPFYASDFCPFAGPPVVTDGYEH